MKICKCGAPSDGWPGDGGDDELCQTCWEAWCDAEFWWQMGEPFPCITVSSDENA